MIQKLAKKLLRLTASSRVLLVAGGLPSHEQASSVKPDIFAYGSCEMTLMDLSAAFCESAFGIF